MNYTEYTLAGLRSKKAKTAFFKLAGPAGENSVSEDACAEADCLHPCFGPLHGRACHLCYATWTQTKGKGRNTLCNQCEIDFTEWKFPHIMTFE